MTKTQKMDSAVTHSVDQLDVDEAVYSDLGASIDTDMTSLSSTVRNHVYENGRRYHSLNSGTYVIPNDEAEQERLDLYHHITSLMLNGELHLVRLPQKLDRVLDVGTGTGIWAIDMADSHPQSAVTGVDLSPIQPSWVPPNCAFEVDDIEKPWMWKEPFDFIHSANLAQGIRDWPQYIQRMYENLAPGGVVQLHESRTIFESDDDSIPKDGCIQRYVDCFQKAGELAQLRPDVSGKLQTYLEDAGFVEIRVVVKKLPIGPWAKDHTKKELGKWGMGLMAQGIRAFGLALFTRHLGISTEEATSICESAFKECCRRDVHSYVSQWFVEGKKSVDA